MICSRPHQCQGPGNPHRRFPSSQVDTLFVTHSLFMPDTEAARASLLSRPVGKAEVGHQDGLSSGGQAG